MTSKITIAPSKLAKSLRIFDAFNLTRFSILGDFQARKHTFHDLKTCFESAKLKNLVKALEENTILLALIEDSCEEGRRWLRIVKSN